MKSVRPCPKASPNFIGTTPTIESDRTLAVVSFPLRSAIQRMTETSPVAENGADVAKNVGNVAKNVAKNVGNGAENVPVNENDGKNEGKNEGKNIPVNENEGKNEGKKIIPRQKSIIELIRSNPTISMLEMATILNVSISTIERDIPKMESLIRHIGPKKGGHWEIIES